MRDFVANDLRWCSLEWPKHHVVWSISVKFEPVICQVVLRSLLPQECPTNPESHVFIKQIESASISCYYQSLCKYLLSEMVFCLLTLFRIVCTNWQCLWNQAVNMRLQRYCLLCKSPPVRVVGSIHAVRFAAKLV